MLISLLVLVVVVCLIIYAIGAWNPPAPFRNILYGVVVVLLILWLLGGQGVLGPAWPRWR